MTRMKNHTAWAGALAVAAELSRRGYDAAITLGNTPALDIICSSPEEKSFTMQIKSLSKANWVLIRKEHLERAPRSDLYFAVVLVTTDDAKPFVFHILTHADVCESYGRQSRVKKDGQPHKSGMEGLAWGEVTPFLNKWDKLPS